MRRWWDLTEFSIVDEHFSLRLYTVSELKEWCVESCRAGLVQKKEKKVVRAKRMLVVPKLDARWQTWAKERGWEVKRSQCIKKKKNHQNHTSMFFCPRKVSPLGPIQALLELNQLGLLLVQICSPTQRYIRKVIQPQSESLRSHSTTGCILNLNFWAYHKNRKPPLTSSPLEKLQQATARPQLSPTLQAWPDGTSSQGRAPYLGHHGYVALLSW